jgi:ferredoxin
MPIVQAAGKMIDCLPEANLRQVLLQQGVPLHNGSSSVINCRGLGTCGTCAVQVEGAIAAMNWRERSRLSLPPHNLNRDRRLACQLQLFGDVALTKYDGFWGQGDRPLWTPNQEKL